MEDNRDFQYCMVRERRSLLSFRETAKVTSLGILYDLSTYFEKDQANGLGHVQCACFIANNLNLLFSLRNS